MNQQRTYAEYVPPRGLAWLRWALQRFPQQVLDPLRAMYRHRYPPPEISRYIGLRARVIRQNRLLPPVGSHGIVTRSEVRDGERVYIIEFENMTLISGLPASRIVELASPQESERSM